MSMPIYFDYAAATPVDDAAIHAATPYLQQQFYNPSAIYEPARSVRRAVEQARADVASVLGSKNQEIYFTAGGTEANNIAIHGVMGQYPDGHMLVSAIEHESVLEAARTYDHDEIPVSNLGLVSVKKCPVLIKPNTVLISVMYANNEIGTVQPIRELAQMVNAINKQRRTEGNKLPLYLHTDACQAANYLDLHVSRLGVDMMTLNGGKIYSFKQSGCLFVHKAVRLRSVTQGGGQESGVRNGTENVAAITAFATMLHKVQKKKQSESDRLLQLRNELIAKLSQKIPNVSLNGDIKKRLPNNLNICIDGIDGERAVLELDELGVLASTGSACTASNDEPSHVLRAIGLSPAAAGASLRFTLGLQTTEEEINNSVDKIVQAVQNSRLLV